MPAQTGDQQGGIDRLAQVVAHARRERRLTVLDGHVGGHRDDRQREALCAQDARSAQSVEHRHLQVHQHRIERTAAGPDRSDPLLPVGRQLHLGAGMRQEFLGHLPIDRMVFDHQQTQTGQRELDRVCGRRERRRLRCGRRLRQHALNRLEQGHRQHRLQQHGVNSVQ